MHHADTTSVISEAAYVHDMKQRRTIAMPTLTQAARVDNVHWRACITSRPEVDWTLKAAAILVVVRMNTMSSRKRTCWPLRLTVGYATNIRRHRKAMGNFSLRQSRYRVMPSHPQKNQALSDNTLFQLLQKI